MENTNTIKPQLWAKKALSVAKSNPIIVLLAIVSITI